MKTRQQRKGWRQKRKHTNKNKTTPCVPISMEAVSVPRARALWGPLVSGQMRNCGKKVTVLDLEIKRGLEDVVAHTFNSRPWEVEAGGWL